MSEWFDMKEKKKRNIWKFRHSIVVHACIEPASLYKLARVCGQRWYVKLPTIRERSAIADKDTGNNASTYEATNTSESRDVKPTWSFTTDITI